MQHGNSESTTVHSDAKETSYGDFLALFSRHSRRIYGFVRTLVIDVNDANDVYQNTTLCLWQKFDEFTLGTSFFAWACQIVHWEVLKFRHDKHRHLHFSDDLLDLMASNVLSRIDELDHREQALGDCIKGLRREDQLLLEQRYYYDQKPKDIAQGASRSIFSIYRSLTRIHDLLFRCIDRKLSERV